MVSRHRRSSESYSGRGVFQPERASRKAAFPVRKTGTRKVVIVPCIPHRSVHLNTDALNHHIHWRLCAPVQGSFTSPCRIDCYNAGHSKNRNIGGNQSNKKLRNYVTFPLTTWIPHVTCDVTNVTFNVTYFINRRMFSTWI